MSLTTYNVFENWNLDVHKATRLIYDGWAKEAGVTEGTNFSVIPDSVTLYPYTSSTVVNTLFTFDTLALNSSCSSGSATRYPSLYWYRQHVGGTLVDGAHLCYVRCKAPMYWYNIVYSPWTSHAYTDSDSPNSYYVYVPLSNVAVPVTFSSTSNESYDCNNEYNSYAIGTGELTHYTLSGQTGWNAGSLDTFNSALATNYVNDFEVTGLSDLVTYLGTTKAITSYSFYTNGNWWNPLVMLRQYKACTVANNISWFSYLDSRIPIFNVEDQDAIYNFLTTGDASGRVITDNVSRIKIGAGIYAIKDATARASASNTVYLANQAADVGNNANLHATQALTGLTQKQDTLTAGTNITIVDNVISATGGSSYTEYTGTLTAGSTSLTISGAAITTSSVIDVYYQATTAVSPLCYNTILVSAGSVTMTFDAQSADLNVKIRVS